MVNNHDSPLVLQVWSQVLSYFYKLLRAFSLSRQLVEFSLKLLYSIMCGKNFQVYGIHILENALILCIFTHAAPYSKLAHKFLLSRPKQKEITHSTRKDSFENLFPPRAELGIGGYDFPLSKFSQKIWRWLGILDFLYFVWFALISNVMALQFCK